MKTAEIHAVTDRAKGIVGRDLEASLAEEKCVYEVRDGVVAICGGGTNGQRYYRLKFAGTYYGEMTHCGLYRFAWADVSRTRT